MTTKRILILGGGFSGLYSALEFEKAIKRGADIEVTLVNRENFFLFTPMLHEVAASDLDLSHIVNPIRKLLKRVKVFNGDVEKIDIQAKKVRVSHGNEHHDHELEYDHLILSLGSVTNFLNIPGLEDRALTMKTLGDAIFLRNQLIENMEEADFECCAHKRTPLLTVVVAGGGFAGVETLASVNDFVREALRHYRNLSEDQLRMVLVHPGKIILPELGEKLGSYAQQKLIARGVEVRVNTRVTGMTDEGVQLNDGTLIPSRMLVWTAGTTPSPLLKDLPCAKEKGRVVVNQYMEAEGWPGVWALGDCALVPDQTTGKPCPPTAQHALRQGKVLARNILAEISNTQKKPFVFSTLGQLATIGRRTGVANIMGRNFSGFIAWFLWRTIYLSKLPRFEKKVRVAIDWTLDLLFTKDLVQFMTLRGAALEHKEEQNLPIESSSDACPIELKSA